MSTFTVTNGAKGDKGDTGPQGLQGVKGQDGKSINEITKTGTSGLVDTYEISLTDGTKKSFTVANGKGIKSIAKTSTSGLVDTYTITYNDGTASTFTVTNGKESEGMGRWKEVGRQTFSEDGQNLVINGFSASIVKITGVISNTSDNKSYAVSFSPTTIYDNVLMKQVSSTAAPFVIIAQSVGNYIYANMPNLVNVSYQSNINISPCYCNAYESDGSISSVMIGTTYGAIAKGSWFKVEVWEE